MQHVDNAVAVPRRALGSTGIQVSCLGLGTVKFGRNQGVKYPVEFDLPDDTQVRNILALAQDIGINLLDTAPAYGSSEERLGKLISNRHDWILCSKTGEEFSNGVSHFDFSAQHTKLSIERSLKRLRTDYLDLVLVHSDGNDDYIIQQTDCFEILQQLKQQGLIRAFGLSGKTVAGGLAALQQADAVMVTYNPQQTAEREVIQQAHRMNKAVLIKKAFNSGHAVAAAPGPSADANRADINQPHNQNTNPAQDNLRFIFSEPGVSAVIVGTTNTRHLLTNARAVQIVASNPA